jgi:hypothetical protein
MTQSELVAVRTPTYRRPAMLRRALGSLIAQSHPHWVCTVFDDDPNQSGRAVVESMDDPRIRYRHNAPQRFASRNIDQCFSSENPEQADFFCVVEDDNYLLADFMRDNIRLCKRHGVELLLRNQLVEHASGTDGARLGSIGVLDGLFTDRVYPPEEFRLSLLAGIGVSNGGMFWSSKARSHLEIGYKCTATLQEYMRTYSIAEPICVAMTPLAVWAENAELTTRNSELSTGYLRRELDLKRAIQKLQRLTWRHTPSRLRSGFLRDERYSAPTSTRARHLTKALILVSTGDALPLREKLALHARGLMIALLGRTDTAFRDFTGSRRPTSI